MSLVGDTLAHRRWLIGYENASVRELMAVYTKRTRALIGRLEAIQKQLAAGEALTPAQAAQAGRDRVRLRRAYARLTADVQAATQTRLERAVAVELRTSARTLTAGLPRGVTARAPAVDIRTLVQNPTAGQLWAARLDASATPALRSLDAALAISIDRGASMPEAARLVAAALDKVGQHRRGIARIVRTEIQRVSNQAAQATYRENRDVVKSVRYLATLDSRVCEVCRPLHRITYDLDIDGQHRGPVIPQHPNCRCFYAPVTYSIGEILTRRATG